MSIQQTRDACFALARKQLEEWCQILRAHDLMREHSMQQLHILHGAPWMDTLRLKRHDRPNRLGRIDEVQTRAEQT